MRTHGEQRHENEDMFEMVSFIFADVIYNMPAVNLVLLHVTKTTHGTTHCGCGSCAVREDATVSNGPHSHRIVTSHYVHVSLLMVLVWHPFAF